MIICVIPDLHTRIDVAKEIINKEESNVDRIIFLGDYFDAYFDNEKPNAATARFIKKYLNNEKFKFCIGNHDLQYIFNVPPLKTCSYTDEKFKAINKVLTDKDWENFEWVVEEENWLFSHAGVRLSEDEFLKQNYEDTINIQLEKVINKEMPQSEYFYKQGKSILWKRHWNDDIPFAKGKDFIYNQMYGHSFLARWDVIQYAGYRVYNIDTNMQNYAIIDTKKETVDVKRTSYIHRYLPQEIKCLEETNQIKNL